MRLPLPRQNLLPYYLAVVLTYVIWGAAAPIVKLTLDYLPIGIFLLFRFILVCTLLLPYTIFQLKKHPIHRSDIGKIILLGLFSQTSIALVFAGLKFTTALEATLIGVLGPILTVFVGHYLYNEKINKNIRVGLILAVVGTLFTALVPLLTASGIDKIATQKLWGNLFVILYHLAFLIYIIWSKISLGENTLKTRGVLRWLHLKPMKRHYSPLLLMSLSFYVGLVTFIPYALLEFANGAQVVFNITSAFGVLYMAVLSSIVAYFGFEWALTKIEIKDVSIISYLQPVFTLPFAYLLLREIPTGEMLVGAALIAVGVSIAEYHKA
ncbi:DMT family transporter [Patescibacteria group bacterium]